MAEAEKAQMLQSISLTLAIIGIILVILAIILLIKANGWMKGIKTKKEAVPSKRPNAAHSRFHKKANTSISKEERIQQDIKRKNTDIQDDISVTQPLRSDMNPYGMESDKTRPIKKQSSSQTEDTDETVVLKNPVATNGFRVTKKIMITHKSKEE